MGCLPQSDQQETRTIKTYSKRAPFYDALIRLRMAKVVWSKLES
jgi:hypothetical protein